RETVRKAAGHLGIGDGGNLPRRGCGASSRPGRHPDPPFGSRRSQECGHRRVPEASGCEISMTRILFDTNVVLDVLLDRQPQVDASAAAWAAVETGVSEGLLAAHAVTTIHYLIRKEMG